MGWSQQEANEAVSHQGETGHLKVAQDWGLSSFGADNNSRLELEDLGSEVSPRPWAQTHYWIFQSCGWFREEKARRIFCWLFRSGWIHTAKFRFSIPLPNCWSSRLNGTHLQLLCWYRLSAASSWVTSWVALLVLTVRSNPCSHSG